MTYPLTIAARDMRGINRSAVLELIRRDGPIARTTIAERLEMSLPTVMRIVDDLVAEDLVRATESKEWSGGRRRALLELNAESQVVIGVDLGGSQFYGALSDLAGKILEEQNAGQPGSGGEASYEQLAQLIDSLIHSPQLQGRRVRGIGVGAPGITRHRDGIVQWAFSLDWRDFPLKNRLCERFLLPAIVDNDVNLAALGEMWYGAGQNAQNLVLIAIGSGIGAGIIIDGALYRGARESSGEVGHMIPGREFLGRRYEEFGALESVASGTGIAARARKLLEGKRDPAELERLTAEEVLDAARQGQKWAKGIVVEVVDYLAIAIANLAVSFDPELIVLGGSVTRSADLLIEPILKRMQGMIPTLPRLVVSPLGRRAVVMGAIINVLHNTDNFYRVRKLS